MGRKMSVKKGYLGTSQDPEDQGHALGNDHENHPAGNWLRSASDSGDAQPSDLPFPDIIDNFH